MIVLQNNPTIRYVYFIEKTGSITHIVKEEKDTDQPFIKVDYEEVRPVLTRKMPFTELKVEYDTKERNYVLKSAKSAVELYDVSDIICKFTNNDNADILLIQDIKNTCWKIEINKTLRTNLLKAHVGLDTVMSFSVTKKDNPNVLLKLLKVNLRELVEKGYKVLPYTQDFEEQGTPVSIYTSKRFESYSHKVIR